MTINSNLYKIIEGQYSTEKTVKLADKYHCITFNVIKNASKKKIKHAVEHIFNVKVLSINTLITKGKKVKFKNLIGKKSDIKKAIITLKKGYDINLAQFE